MVFFILAFGVLFGMYLVSFLVSFKRLIFEKSLPMSGFDRSDKIKTSGSFGSLEPSKFPSDRFGVWIEQANEQKD